MLTRVAQKAQSSLPTVHLTMLARPTTFAEGTSLRCGTVPHSRRETTIGHIGRLQLALACHDGLRAAVRSGAEVAS